MPSNQSERRLAAILAMDVAGYSRLMEADEERTLSDLTAAIDALIAPTVEAHAGRVVKTTGDGVLASFDSAIQAVKCAVEIQDGLGRQNERVDKARRLEFRIGINVGDIIVKDGDVFGDGVNAAARLEGLAKPGQILISGAAFDQIKKALKLGFKFEGERKVKNFKEPIRVYRVLAEASAAGRILGVRRQRLVRWAPAGIAAALVLAAGMTWWWQPWTAPIDKASPVRMAHKLPDKPSIAVLAFDNLTGDPKQEYLADGLSENIIAALSKIPEIFVIARNSSFTYKGKAVKVSTVAEDLGVRHVLEGSVQRDGDKVRVTAQLIDALNGHHLWSETYDRKVDDIFAVQDAISKKIVVALQVKLTEGDQAHLRASTTHNLKAWAHSVRANTHLQRFSKDGNAQARELYRKAVDIDPKHAGAWTGLAWTHLIDIRFGYTSSIPASFQQAAAIGKKAIALNPELPELHILFSTLALYQRDYDTAVAQAEHALRRGPQEARVNSLAAQVMLYMGKWQRAADLGTKAIRLSPYARSWYYWAPGRAYSFLGKHEQATTTLKAGLSRAESPFMKSLFHFGLSVAHSEAGQLKEAKSHMQQAVALNPRISVQYFKKSTFYKEKEHDERIIGHLRKAGLNQ